MAKQEPRRAPLKKNTIERLPIQPERFGLSGFRELVRVTFSESAPALWEHIHQDAMEICYFYRGGQTYQVDGENYTVGAGEIFLTYPNEPHSTNFLEQEKDGVLYYLILDTVNHLDRFLGLPEEEGAALAGELNRLERSFYVGYELKKHLDQMFALTVYPAPLCTTLLRCHACLLLHLLLESGGMARQRPSDAIRLVLDYMDHHLSNPPSVAELAKMISCSESHFKQKFRREVGLPPAKYLMKQRISAAKQMLLSGAGVTQTAYALGFSSSQHFTTCFKSYLGVPPRAWLRQNQARNPSGHHCS